MKKLKRKNEFVPRDWLKPIGASIADIYLGGDEIGKWLPAKKDIPKEFFNYNNEWAKIAERLFYNGGKLPRLKHGIDVAAATADIGCCLQSFEPSHEHKIAGVAYLLSMWCEPE